MSEDDKETDGLVSRSGYRRTLPGWLTDDSGLWDDRAQQLTDIAHRELQGRNLEIFERLILGPLNGAERPAISDLAEQYGVPIARIYRITNDCKTRVMTALQRGSIAEPTAARGDFGPEEIMAMLLQAEREIFDGMVLYHSILRRSAAVEALLIEADVIWDKPAREYVCRTSLLNGYLDRLKALIATANDPILANPSALHVVGSALKANLPACLSTCSCGGYGPRLPWDE
jgi:hypothetical protein